MAALSTGCVALTAHASPAMANDATAQSDAIADETAEEREKQIVVTGYAVKELSDPKRTLPVLDTPATVTVVADKLLEEQGRRTLRDSLRNITGVSFQAGEGNPPGGGDSFSVRGFSGRDDIFVDGIRDPGNYFRDPFYADRIEVTKGPASAFAGRGNIGGTVNIVTRQPDMDMTTGADLSVGTHDQYRATGDINIPISQELGIAFRINGMAHIADEPGRDHVKNERWAIAPSLGFGLDTDTRVTLNYLHLQQDDQPDFGIPNARNRSLAGSGFEGRPAPVRRSNYYGYSNDYLDVVTDMGTIKIEHDFSEAVSIQNQTRYARVRNDSIISAPRFVGNVTTLNETTRVLGNRKPRFQTDKLFINQTNLTVRFGTGEIRHTTVAGLEIVDESTENRRRLDTNGPATNLFNPVLGPAPVIPFNGTRARIDTDTVAAYVFHTMEIGNSWRITGGLRYDDVDTRVRGFDDNGIAPGFVVDVSRGDKEWSGNAAIIYKPSENSSIYVAYGTAFEPSGRSEIVQVAGGNNAPPTAFGAFDVAPETGNAFEAGAKYALMDGELELSAAVFQITRDNARTPGLNPGDPAVVLEGEQRVRGFELQAVGSVTPDWNIFAGYSYLDAKVVKSNIPFEVGQRLDNTPKHSVALWTSYDVTGELTLGGGVQHLGKRRSNVQPSATAGNITITVPSYTVVDAFAEYRLNAYATLRLNVYNVGNEYYFQSFASAQSIPSASRNALLTLSLSY
ncbi:TonB-dependent receptor [Blastomonas sp.]|uniref:TonB-dependent receptor n=1 Tax=Blastomonas sp. TaxID=1909299 RepID=UPI0035934FA1